MRNTPQWSVGGSGVVYRRGKSATPHAQAPSNFDFGQGPPAREGRVRARDEGSFPPHLAVSYYSPMERLMVIALISVLFGASLAVNGQTSIHQSDPCDKETTFCWYGPYQDGSDEVDAWGDRWVAQDKSEKSLEISTAIRCVKRIGLCIYASSQIVLGSRRVTKVDLLPITRWDNAQITADGESASREPCDRDSYLINKGDRSVTLVSSPGPKAESSGCTAFMGKPKTVVYRLQRD